MVINTNISAQTSARLLGQSARLLAKSLARLSSGSRLASPEDDAAGLAVSMRFDAQINRTQATINNLGNALSWSHTQDGFLNKVGKALQRMSELAVLAQDVTKSDADRGLYNQEFQTLSTYISDVATKDFNGVSLFSSNALNVTVDAEGGTFAMNGISATYFAPAPSAPAQQFNGDINGNVDSAIDGDINGNINGNVNAAITGNITGDINGNVNAAITGNVTGNINGNVNSNITGNINGDINGNIAGNVTGDITGTINGNVGGNINGDVNGDINGNVSGTINGVVSGSVNGLVTGSITGVSSGSNNSGPNSSSAGDISTTSGAASALTTVKSAISQLASDRATIGATISRISFTTGQLATLKDNLSAANSRIKDVDVAQESSNYARDNILVQAGTAMLAQANSQPQSVLRLLG